MSKKIEVQDLLGVWANERSSTLIDTHYKLSVMAAFLRDDILVGLTAKDKASATRHMRELIAAKMPTIWSEAHFEPQILQNGPISIKKFDDAAAFETASKNCATLWRLIHDEMCTGMDLAKFVKLDRYVYKAIIDAHQLLGHWLLKLPVDMARTLRSSKTHGVKKAKRMNEIVTIYNEKRKNSPAWETYTSDAQKAGDISNVMADNKRPGLSTIRNYLREARRDGLLKSNKLSESDKV